MRICVNFLIENNVIILKDTVISNKNCFIPQSELI